MSKVDKSISAAAGVLAGGATAVIGAWATVAMDALSDATKVFLSSSEMRGSNGGALGLAGAQRSEPDGEDTITTPFTPTGDGAIALNAALGVDFFGPHAVLADLTPTVRGSV